MAADNQSIQPLGRQEPFNSFETLHFPSPPPSLPFAIPNSNSKRRTCTSSQSPITSEEQTLLQKPPDCPLCKGTRHQFTAYFHNPRIFSSPPHHLLPLIERSYGLASRLKSLLITYALHPVKKEHLPTIQTSIAKWVQDVKEFTTHVLCSAARFELDHGRLEEVKEWVIEMGRQMTEHVSGGTRLDMPKGRLRVLVGEFRLCWQGVWRGYLRDEADPGTQYEHDVGQSLQSLAPALDGGEAGQWNGVWLSGPHSG